MEIQLLYSKSTKNKHIYEGGKICAVPSLYVCKEALPDPCPAQIKVLISFDPADVIKPLKISHEKVAEISLEEPRSLQKEDTRSLQKEEDTKKKSEPKKRTISPQKKEQEIKKKKANLITKATTEKKSNTSPSSSSDLELCDSNDSS